MKKSFLESRWTESWKQAIFTNVDKKRKELVMLVMKEQHLSLNKGSSSFSSSS